MYNQFNNIDVALKVFDNWVLWKKEQRYGKATKVPYQENGRRAKVNDSATWASYDKIISVFNRGGYDGIGFVFKNTPFIGIDIDACHDFLCDSTSEEAKQIINIMQSYTEFSPSENGIHIIAKGSLPRGKRRDGNIEMYGHESPRYFTMTGNLFSPSHSIVEERQKEIQEVHKRYLKKEIPVYLSNEEKYILLGKARSAKNKDLFIQLYDEGDISDYANDDSSADLALCSLLAFWTNKNAEQIDQLFRESALYRPKWDERHSIDNTYGEMTIKKAIEDAYSAYNSQTETSYEDLEWEELIPLEDDPVAAFPVHLLPTSFGEYVKEVSESLQVPTAITALIALATIATTVQKKYVVQVKEDWLEPLNIYGLCIAQPAERKSAVMSKITKFLREYEEAENKRLSKSIRERKLERDLLGKNIKELTAKGDLNSINELIKLETQLENTPEIKPVRLLADDVTPEALSSLLAENNGKIALFSAEGGIFDTLSGRYQKIVNIDSVLKAHSGDDIRIDRKGRPPEYVKNPALTMLVSAQPDILNGMMNNSNFRGRGLTARFLYVIPDSYLGKRDADTKPISATSENNFRHIVFSLLESQKNMVEKTLKLSSEAKNISLAFAKWLEPLLDAKVGELAALNDWAGKLHGQIMRIAGIIHCIIYLENSEFEPIAAETLKIAIEIGNHFLENAKIAYGIMGADISTKNALYLLNKIKEHELSQFNLREITRSCRKFKKSEQIKPSLELLEEYGYIRKVSSSASSKNAGKQWIVNPCVFEDDL